MKYSTATPYIACYVILRKGKKIAFVKRANTGWMDGYYGLVAGKVEKHETFTMGAVREAKEEVGVDINSSDLRHALTAHRRAEIDWVDMLFEVDKWQGEPYNAEPNVHSEMVWLDADNLPDSVIPAVRFYLEQVKAGVKYTEFGWDD